MRGKFTRVCFILMMLLGAAGAARGQCSIYPAGLSGLTIDSVADSLVVFHWTSTAPGQSYTVTVTNDSTNSNFSKFTYLGNDITDTFLTQGSLAPNTHYFIFVNDDACSGSIDSISFTTKGWNCAAHVPPTAGILSPILDPCTTADNFFGIANTTIYQQYSFLQNGKSLGPKYTNIPGAGSNGNQVSYPVAVDRSSAGQYQVATFYAGCPDTAYSAVQDYYYAGVINVKTLWTAAGSAEFNWSGPNPFLTPNQYQWGINTSPVLPDSMTTTTDTFATVSGLKAGQYYLFVTNSAYSDCSGLYDTLPFVITNCGALPPVLSLTGGPCAAATGLAVSQLLGNETFSYFRNGQAMSTLAQVDSALAQGGYNLSSTDTGAYYVVAYDACKDSVSSDTVYNYPSGVMGLQTTYTGDTLVAFHFNGAPGDSYTYTITTDPRNSDPAQVADQLNVKSLTDTAGQLLPDTQYYLFVGDSVCGGVADSVSFTTMPYACSHQLLPGVIPDQSVCQSEPSYGMPVTSIYQQYTFLHNGQAIPDYTSRPGSSSQPISYPVPDGQAASGSYQVITSFPGCPQVDSGNVEYWWFGGVGNLTINSMTDTSVHFTWLTAQEHSQYLWAIGTDPVNVPSTTDTTSDTTAVAGGLTPNTKYYLYVTNLTVSSCQFEYDTLSFTTADTSTTACGLSGLTTTTTGSTQVAFHWSGVAPAQTYAWVITTDPANSQPNLVAAQGTTTDTSAVGTGLTPGTTYYLFVDDLACGTIVNTITFATTTTQTGGGTSSCAPGTVPVPKIGSSTGSFTACGNTGVSLTSTSSTGNQWFLDGNPLPDSNRAVLIARQSGNYSVSVTDTAGCSDSSAIQSVVIIPNLAGNQTPTIFPSGPIVSCTDTVLLLAANAFSFQWYFNGNRMTGENSALLSVTQSGSYTVTTDSTACGAPSAPSTAVVVTLVPAATPVISLINGVLVSTFPDDNQWYLDDTLITGATQQDYSPQTPGSYTVRIELPASGSGTIVCDGPYSAPYLVSDSVTQTPQVRVYPNPIKSLLTLQNMRPSPATVRIFTLQGQQLVMIQGLSGTQQLEVATWGKGPYIIEIIDEKTHKTGHVEIIKL